MGKRTRNVDYHETIKMMIREAVMTSLWVRLHGHIAPESVPKSGMPDVVREFWEAYGQEAAKMSPKQPQREAISRWDLVVEAMTHAGFDNPVRDRRILWGRAIGRSWKELCRELKIERTTGWKSETHALVAFGAYIAERKNLIAA